MNRKRMSYLFGAVLLLAFAGFSLASFRQTLTPYVSFSDAQKLERTVQVAGGLVKNSWSYDDAGKALHFTLRQTDGAGETIRVRYNGVKPGNFEDAISIVAIGRFDAGSKELVANKLLVKCPSKYQGAEVTKTYS
jgi:cytochrome c-type biogenesis protein CcmE